MNRWFWVGVMVFAFVMGSMQAYNLGYSHAKGFYEDEMWQLRIKHTDQLQKMLKDRIKD